MGPANNLNYLIQHIAAVQTRQTDQLLADKLDIRLSQYRILMVLEWNPRVEQKVIANALGQSEASISRQTKVLIKKGLLEVKPDPKDKRSRISMPTPKGMQTTEEATNLLKHKFTQDYDNFKATELSNLSDSLISLHKSICKQGKLGACNHLLGF